jgi:DNA-binding XRE family transcriptional regulator
MVRIKQARHAGGYKLRLQFTDGSRGTVDLEPTLRRIRALSPLLDVERFAEVNVDHGTVTWPGDLDLAPETLYAMAHGLEMPKSFGDVDRNELIMSLRSLREMAGMTQTDVAEELDVPQSNLSRFENAQDMKLSTLRRYVEALGGELELVATIGDRRMVIHGIGVHEASE